jgi:PAS domain S-box-containing protein
MGFNELSTQKKLAVSILLVSGMVLLVAYSAFFFYSNYLSRQASIDKVAAIGKIISANTAPALIAADIENAKKMLSALKYEPHIVVAYLYNKEGNIVAGYPDTIKRNAVRVNQMRKGYRFANSFIEGVEPITENGKQLGMLYVKSSPITDLYERFIRYGVILILIIGISFPLAYGLLQVLQKSIALPILALAKTAEIVSQQKNYSVRAVKSVNGELGLLTDAFNHMLVQIQEQNQALNDFNKKLEQKIAKDTIELGITHKELHSHAKQLMEREKQIQTIFSNAPDAIVLTDKEGKIVTWNPKAESIFGWEAKAIIGKNFQEFIIPDQFHEEYQIGIKHFLRTKEKTLLDKPVELSARRCDNGLFAARISTSPTMLGGGYHFISFISDISDRKRNEAQLKENAHKFRGLLDSAPDAIIIVEDDGKISMANSQTEKLFEFRKDEIIGKPVEWLIPERFHTAHSGHRENFFADPKRREMGVGLELFGKRKSGSEFPIEVSLSPYKTNKEVLVFAAIRDITERRRAEEEIKKKSTELARSNSELEQFAYVASHDLQEPLRMVSSFLQLLEKQLKDKLDQDSKEYIAFAVDGSKRMQNLINSLLEYSRVNSMKPFEWLDSNKIIDAALLNLNGQIEGNDVIVERPRLPIVYGDAVLMTQLFQNLIANAIKFKSKEKPRIRIDCSDQQSHWLFSIRDNGIGIKPEYFNKIFIIFQRLHTREEFPGTGIGLSICKKIVERHGGKIWLESVMEKGSVFYFTILK